MWLIARVVVVLAVVTPPVYSGEPKASDVEVSVMVGPNAIPLGVEHRFRQVAGALPKPGTLPVTDPHDRQHDSRTYCYRFGTKGNEQLLEFFDSDFGVHTARVSRGSPLEAECTEVLSQPTFNVNGTLFALGTKELPTLQGFLTEKKDDSLVLKRHWTYTDLSKSHQWGRCFSREVSIEAKPAKGSFTSITVMNWDEPGC